MLPRSSFSHAVNLSASLSILADSWQIAGLFSWRIFWDVQAGQYAHTTSEKYDCINGAMEFWATGSTAAAYQYSADCPGDCTHPPQPPHCPARLNHTAMIAAAKPGSFNDADMLPIGATWEGAPSFTVDQAYSAMAMWCASRIPLRCCPRPWLPSELVGTACMRSDSPSTHAGCLQGDAGLTAHDRGRSAAIGPSGPAVSLSALRCLSLACAWL